MGQVTVTLNGRTYRLRCGDGEEQRLLSVADYVRERVDTLTKEHGQIGDERLILMAAILITDELFEFKEFKLAPMVTAAERPPAKPTASAPADPLPIPVAPRAPLRQAAPLTAHAPADRATLGHAAHMVARPFSAPAPLAPLAQSSGPASAPPEGAPPVQNPRAVEHLDANALMRGLDRKAGRP